MSKVIKPAAKRRAAVAAVAASVIGTRRPGYVIVFRERSEANTGVLSRALKVGSARGVAVRAGRAVLASNHEWAAQPRVYERMGIAVADLDDGERAQLEKDEHVAVVAKNEVRSLPPIIAYDEQKDVAGPSTLALPLAGLARRQEELEGSSWMKAYATGVRDTADLFVQLLSGGPDGGTAQAVASTPKLSWALRILGLDDDAGLSVANDLRKSAHVRHHDGQLAGRRLDHGDAEAFAFAAAQGDEYIHPIEQFRNLFIRDLRDELNEILKAQLVDELEQYRP